MPTSAPVDREVLGGFVVSGGAELIVGRGEEEVKKDGVKNCRVEETKKDEVYIGRAVTAVCRHIEQGREREREEYKQLEK